MFDATRTLLKENGALITAGFLLVFFSVFGQSVFFGAYLPAIQDDLGLTKTATGSLYATATIASSIAIIFTGKGLDYYPLRHFIAFVFCGLAIGCFVLSDAHTPLSLLIAFFLLRQFGQGLMVLSSNTAINRYLKKNRGKAVALAGLGGSVHIIVFPLLALTLQQYMDWRATWVGYGLFTLFVLLPGFWIFLKGI